MLESSPTQLIAPLCRNEIYTACGMSRTPPEPRNPIGEGEKGKLTLTSRRIRASRWTLGSIPQQRYGFGRGTAPT